MEEQSLNSRRRSTRSTSKPPLEVMENIGESNLRVSSRFQTIQEMVVQEKSQTTEVTFMSVTEERNFVQTDEAIELQNRLNQNQEVTKTFSTKKTAENQGGKKVRRSVRAKQTTVNGSSTVKKTKKSVGQSSDVTASVAAGETAVFTPVSTRSVDYQAASSGKHYSRSTDSSIARKFYDSAMSGEKNVSESVFWRYYKPVGEWWNFYPKTDNTYSPLSRCRYELAPGMMAMPNLSRRSIQGVHTSAAAGYSSWFSSVDSDDEEYESRQSRQHQYQATYMQRVTTTLKYVFLRTLTTILTIFTVLYSNTIGAVVGLFTQGSDQRCVSHTPLLLRPIGWIVDLVRYFALMEVTILAWLNKGQRRNILLWLLLFLLLAVPAYILYQGAAGERTGILTWLTDGITNILLLARSTLSSPLAWISSIGCKVWDVAMSFVTTPVQWLISHGLGLVTRIQYPFIWIFAATQQEKVDIAEKHSGMQIPKAAVVQEGYKSNQEVDIELLSQQILQSVAFKNLQADLKSDFKVPESHASLLLHITEELKQLRVNLESLKQESEDKPADSKQHIFHALQREIKHLERRVRLLQLHQSAGKNCCDNMEEQVAAIVAGLFGGGDAAMPDDAVALIKAKLSVLDNLEARLAKFTDDLEGSQKRALDGLKLQINQASDGKATFDLNSLSDERIRAIVREALAVYDADKTNMVDYALETSGGTILSTRCTENYDYKHGVTFYWGLSWFSKEYRPNNPRTIIQPSVHPGECWAFKGATGFVVIELSTPIQVMAVSMEHIPRSLAPNGKIESAPRDFSVWGLKELMDPEPVLLGRFRYEDNGHPLQTFEVNVGHNGYQKVELRIESNHGHLEYTCVYRFRVHGIPDFG